MEEINDSEKKPRPQHETRWTLVARAASPDEEALQALDELLRIYLPVLEGMLHRWPQLDASTKEDLLQSFVQKRILEKQLLGKADANKGRFRNFLFRAFQNHIVDELRQTDSARRSPGKGNLLVFDELEGALGQTPELEKAYHVAWVRNLLEQGCARLQAECERKQRPDLWLVFETRMKRPFLEGVEPMSYGELVEKLGVDSPSQASNLLVSAKRLLRKHLEDLIRETEDDPDAIQGELQFLTKCLS